MAEGIGSGDVASSKQEMTSSLFDVGVDNKMCG